MKRGKTMEKRKQTVVKLAQTALLAALCFVSFTFLQIKIPMPGGDATSLHIGNAFCVLGALLLGGWYGGLAGAIGMTIADVLDPIYIVGAPKTFVLKLCIGLIVGLVAHRIGKINESTDKKYVFRWSVLASVAGLGFNVIADPLVGYFNNTGRSALYRTATRIVDTTAFTNVVAVLHFASTSAICCGCPKIYCL